MIHALVLAAVAESCNVGTTYDIRNCWSGKLTTAYDAMQAAQRRVTAEMQRLGIDPEKLAAVTAAWKKARDATCDFEYRLYLPGTIAPQLATQCDVRMTQARTRRLGALLVALKARAAASTQTPKPSAQDELDRFYALYRLHIGDGQRAALDASEREWAVYRAKACALEGGACATELDEERVAELRASWIGEPFWP
jgi:uncharacterized protein YecT (DUF1311 family)